VRARARGGSAQVVVVTVCIVAGPHPDFCLRNSPTSRDHDHVWQAVESAPVARFDQVTL
jgi:hypothetical protein